MDDIADITPDGETFKSILDALPKSEIEHYWVEDDFVPYTEYMREQDRIKYIRLWYRDHLAPRV